ncbi:TPA: AAA family ATPase [Vibrio parahaemolyticus]|nr:AAA family ATPase [Vibrio parahaemolyticus]HCM1282087.1 AAA family ATPase [Vibrio parahaemolyticus]
MKSLRIKGLRSIEDSGYIRLKPLTFLLGENSSGKSTFLRTLPLLKQSTENNTRGPILWYDSTVDFGSFRDSLSHFSNEETISFGIEVDALQLKELTPTRYISNGGIVDGSIKIELCVCEGKDNSTVVRSTTIEYKGNKTKLIFDKPNKLTSIICNGYELIDFFDKAQVNPSSNKFIFPEIGFTGKQDWYGRYDNLYNSELREEIEKFIDKFKHGKSNSIAIAKKVTRLSTTRKSELITDFRALSSTQTWKNRTAHLTENSAEIEYLLSLLLASRLPWILVPLNIYISSELSNVNYIAPLRATAERYYRDQDLNIENVDFQGKNLAMFIRNLSEKKSKDYRDWLLKNFGFYLESKSTSGHLSLRITYAGSKRSYNVTDMGFGFSQILPILTQLWFTRHKAKQSNTSSYRYEHSKQYLVIEQPELHLHPRFQSKIVDVLVRMLNYLSEDNLELCIIIETHSETIINQIGHRIGTKSDEDLNLNSDDVSIVIFDKLSPDIATEVSTSKFNSDGMLVDWPWGFFEPELDL